MRNDGISRKKYVTIKKGLMWQILLIFVIVLGLTFADFYAIREIGNQRNGTNLKILSMTVERIEDQINLTENAMASYLSENYSEFVELERSGGKDPYLYWLMNNELIAAFQTNPYVSNVFLYDSNNDKTMIYRNDSLSQIDNVIPYNRYFVGLGDEISTQWRTRYIGGKTYFIRTMKKQGVHLTVYLDGEIFLDDVWGEEDSSFDELFYASETKKPLTAFPLSEKAREVIRDFKENIIFDRYGEKELVFGSGSPDKGITLIGICNKNFLLQNLVWMQIALILLLTVAAFYMIAWGVINHRTLVEPIDQLVYAMEEVGKGNLEITLPEESWYPEFQIVNNQFNLMVKDIEKLKIDVYEEQMMHKNSELKFLQLQINPHFFLNAFNILYTLALTKQTEKIKELVTHLMKHSRYVLEARKERILLSEELKHIENFMEIQRIRYTYPIIYEISVAPGCEMQMILPMLLYTFVENSVKYGLKSKEEGIRIYIDIRQDNDDENSCLRFLINDAGPGYTESILPVLNKGDIFLDERGEEHYGISNIVQRLQLCYHERVKIEFRNKADGGAETEIRIYGEGKDADESAAGR